MVLASGQFTITDMTDITQSATQPTNPTDGMVWQDTSGSPPYKFYTYLNGTWNPTSPTDLAGLDPTASETLGNLNTTITALDDDNQLTRYERSIVRGTLNDMLGYAPNATDTLPAIATVDSSGEGALYGVRNEAVKAGMATTDAKYTAVGNSYTSLCTYLSGLTPVAWDVTSSAITTIVSTTWDTNWNNYLVAVNNLKMATAQLKQTSINTNTGDIGTHDTQIVNLTSRVTSAEQKITPDAITSTVTSSTAWETLQTTTDAKAKTFTSQPVPPYNLGDIWQNGNSIAVCITPKTSTGTFSATDWMSAGDVTSKNTSADTAKVNGNPANSMETQTGAQSKADTAQSNAKTYTDNQITPLNTRLTTAESSITQHANDIALKVDSTTYEQGIGAANTWAKKLTNGDATFTRASVAYDDQGNQVASNTPRYKIVGKNLIDPSSTLYRSNDGSVTVNNYGITINSKTAELAGYLIPAKSSSTYSFSANSLQSTGSRIIEFSTKPTDPSQTNVAIHNDFSAPLTFTTSSTTSWIFVGVYASALQLGQFWTNMQLEEGATVNPFEPFNQGVLQEEGTTNLFTNTNGTATSMTTGGTTPPTATLVSDSTNPFGTQVWEVTFPANTTSGYAGCRVQSNTWNFSASQTYTSTVWIKGMTGDIATYHTGAFALPQMAKTGRSINGYEEFTATGTVGSVAGTNYLVVYALNSPTVATTVHIAVSQVENKSYATSYTNSTRAMESLFITTDVLNSNEWTASVEFEFFHPDVVPFWRMPLSSWTKFYLGVSPSASNLRLSWIDETGTQQTIDSGAVNLNLAGLNTVSIRSNHGTVDVFINGVKAITASTSLPSVMESTNILRIGGLGSGVSYPSNSYFSNFKVSNVARTDAELATPSWEADGFTTAYMDFEGNIQYQYFMSASDYTDNQIAPINTRLTTAESEITPDAITNTVTSSDTYTNDLSNKADVNSLAGYATTEYADNSGNQAVSTAKTYTDDQMKTIDLTQFIQKTGTIQTADDIVTNITKSGGINLIKNSVGFAGTGSPWVIVDGSITTIQSNELDQLGFGSGFFADVGAGGHLGQTFSTIVGRPYTLSFWVRKEVDNATNGQAGIDLYDGSTKLSFNGIASGGGYTVGAGALTNTDIVYGFEPFSVTWVASQPTAQIQLNIGTSAKASITGIMVNEGGLAYSWQLSAGEIYNTNVIMDLNGIKVAHMDANGVETGFTVMTPDKFAGYYDVNQDGVIDESIGSVDEIFRMDAENFTMKNAVAKESIVLDTVQIIKINASGHVGWAFVATSSN